MPTTNAKKRLPQQGETLTGDCNVRHNIPPPAIACQLKGKAGKVPEKKKGILTYGI